MCNSQTEQDPILIPDESFLDAFFNTACHGHQGPFYAEVLECGDSDELKIYVPDWMVEQKNTALSLEKNVVFVWEDWVSSPIDAPSWLDVAVLVNDMMNRYEVFPDPYFSGVENLPSEAGHPLFNICLGHCP